jgi:D-threonate/D-erythronate kinase
MLIDNGSFASRHSCSPRAAAREPHQPLMTNILIIADDLTGAADCGAAFAACGWRSAVALATPDACTLDQYDWRDAEVLAIDADTRRFGPAQAAACVSRLVDAHFGSAAVRTGCTLFKKVDSTLRGNVVAELGAALQAVRTHGSNSARAVALFAPAFPACSRTTVNGQQLVHSMPLDNSAALKHETVVPGRDILAMFGDYGLATALLNLACVRSPVADLERAMAASARAADVLICDAEIDADLQMIVHAASNLDVPIVWSGSAGLAQQLARKAVPARPPIPLARPPAHGPSLFVIGSPAAVSREQAMLLARAADIAVFTIAPSPPLGNGLSHDPLYAMKIREALERGRDVLVRFDSDHAYASEHAQHVAHSLALMIAPCADVVGALVAAGGATSRAILDAWGVRRLRLLGEVEPGLPYSIAQCAAREILILTKAGGFGTPQTLLHCREFLRAITAVEAG